MKRLTLTFFMAVAMICCVLPAGAKEKAVAVFTVTPQMTCQNCENKIKGNLRFEKGIENIVTDLDSQTVTVTYNAEKTDVSKLQAAFKKIGYDATEAKSVCPEQSACAPCPENKACDKAQACGKKKDFDKACDKAKACGEKKACDKTKACDKKYSTPEFQTGGARF